MRGLCLPFTRLVDGGFPRSELSNDGADSARKIRLTQSYSDCFLF